MVKINLSENGV